MSGCGAVGSVLPWGGRGRPFKSGHSDQMKGCPAKMATAGVSRNSDLATVLTMPSKIRYFVNATAWRTCMVIIIVSYN